MGRNDVLMDTLWEILKNLGFFAIHNADCLEKMKTMPAECIGAVVTSPPYNIRNSTGNGLRKPYNSGYWKNNALSEGYDGDSDDMPRDEYVAWQRECLTEMMRLLAPGGAIFYNNKWRVQDGLLQDCSDIVAGFPVRQIIIWARSGGMNFNPGYFLPTYEVIYLIAKPGFRLAEGANRLGDIWRIDQTKDIPHPAPFPIELAQRCILSVPAEYPLGPILDPFMGSGTTAIAASMCDREWMGIEKSEEYCRIANERLAEWRSKQSEKLL